MIDQLLTAINEGENAEAAELLETHISWIILCNEFAYKIKKPVNFGFLDYSSVALRRHFCAEELQLNRRFSPELYLAVVPITQDEGGARFDGAGPTIDYAVKMRRFRQDQLLDAVALRGGLDHKLLRALAKELSRLHDALPACHPDPMSDAPGTPAALHLAIEQNYEQIRRYDLPAAELLQLEVIERWTRQRYMELLPLMRQRLRAGKVIDGHGDAHLGNIAIIDGAVRLFDCIEFNASLRIMDSISEIAFLSMDMDARGYHGAAHRLLTDYLEYSGDYTALPLLGLYTCYFAIVRAKVNLMRESVHNKDITKTHAYIEFLRYLALAKSCTLPRQIFLAITHGVSGSGKSTIAAELVASSGAVRLRSDVERKRLAGLAPEQRSEPQERAELYSAAMSRKTFARLQELAEAVIDAGLSVIVDATFLQRSTRDSFRQLADRLSVPFVIIDCNAPPDQLRQRLLDRARHTQDASEADTQVLESQLSSAQALGPQEQAYRLAVGPTADAAALWQTFQVQCYGG